MSDSNIKQKSQIGHLTALKFKGILLLSLFLLLPSAHITLTTASPLSSSTADHYKENQLQIVCSLSLVGDWVKQVSGDQNTITNIVDGLEDPHSYEPTASEISKVADADLFVWLGIEGLEPWVKSVLESNPNVPTLKLVEESWIRTDPVWGYPNGHVWMSPVLVKEMVTKIETTLASIDPANANTYSTNAANYQAQLDALLNDIQQFKEKYNGTKVVVMHPSFMYLFELLGINRTAIIQEAEGTEPSPVHIAEIVEMMKQEQIKYIITQPQVDDSQVVEIAEQTGALIVTITPLLGVYNLNTYLDMIRYDLNILTAAFEGKLSNTYENSQSLPFTFLPVLFFLLGSFLLPAFSRRFAHE